MIDLYALISPNVQKVYIALEELELPYREHFVDVWKGEQFSSDFIKLNPNSKIPVIIDHDGPGGGSYTVFEFGAILLYLAEKTKRLIPADARRRFDVIQWLMIQLSGIGPTFGNNVHFTRFAPAGNDYSVSRFRTEMRRLYDVLEKRLEQSAFLGGEDYSIADIATFPWTRNHEAHGITFDKFPGLGRWFELIRSRPAVERAQAKVAKIASSRETANQPTSTAFSAAVVSRVDLNPICKTANMPAIGVAFAVTLRQNLVFGSIRCSGRRSLTIKAQVGPVSGNASTQAAREGGRWFVPRPWIGFLLLVIIVATGLPSAAKVYEVTRNHRRAAVARELENFGNTEYQAQKVVYHVDYGAGWFGRNYDFLLSVLQSHERAVDSGKLKLAVVLQGDGLDLLALAKTKPALAATIDKLKSEGVRFLVCKNSLISRAMDPFNDLYGVSEQDIVKAAVAELTALQQDGYVYLHL